MTPSKQWHERCCSKTGVSFETQKEALCRCSRSYVAPMRRARAHAWDPQVLRREKPWKSTRGAVSLPVTWWRESWKRLSARSVNREAWVASCRRFPGSLNAVREVTAECQVEGCE